MLVNFLCVCHVLVPSEEGIRPSRSASLKTRPSATPTATPAVRTVYCRSVL